MWSEYGERVEFLVVYIREAHPMDGASPMGGADGMPLVEDPTTFAERRGVAEVCMTALALEPMPAVIDGLDDAVNLAYSAWPDRLYLIDREGRIAYRGGPGPFEFEPDELERALRDELGLP